jgi:hypothetical protein
VFVPMVLLLLLATTALAQLNRLYMAEVSLRTTALTAQLIGTGSKTVVFLISSLCLHAPPYPRPSLWAGLLVQVCGSCMYVQASFSATTTTTTTTAATGPPSTLFTPNVSSNRLLSRVSLAGNGVFDSDMLGLTPQDIARLRRATAKNNNRLLFSKQRKVKSV